MFSVSAAGRLFLPKIAFIMAVSLIKRYSVAAGTATAGGETMDIYWSLIVFVLLHIYFGLGALFMYFVLSDDKKEKKK